MTSQDDVTKFCEMNNSEGPPKEEEDFAALFGEQVKPLKGNGFHRKSAGVNQSPGLIFRRQAAQRENTIEINTLDSGSLVKPMNPLDHLAYVRPGVQHGVFKNLRLGKYPIQSTLDLHGETVESARQIIKRFIADCRQSGVRSALITHGKGERRPNPAVLKSCVNHWLRQFPEVLAFHSANKLHGGLGATYVLLKKSEEARQTTIEKLRKSKN